ncbi:MAG: CPBP family intramembrane metalloprotease [Muribaculaceae bacterium]|nr:CPBP family intramembrane metalloprotease [Muribaculaceae bacterium]
MENTTDFAQPRFKSSPAVKFLILFALALAGLIACSVLMLICGLNMSRVANMHYVITLQDVFAFIIPAVATMAICYFKPWKAMALSKAPSWKGILVAVLVCAASMPAMNWLVEWNKGIELPKALSGLEEWMRVMEDQGEAITKSMLHGSSVFTLLINLLVVAFIAGLSEEILFRGSMQRILTLSGRNVHYAIWLVAIVFSAIHMQFYGFVPRMLLGAWNGYLLVWTRSLWVPIIAHTLNNGIVVVATWLDSRGIISGEEVDTIGIPADASFPWLAMCSALVTIILIIVFRKWILKNNGN